MEPITLRFDPAPGAPPSDKAPVRIYIGSAPERYRDERVLLWSIARHRDPARAYEVHLMKELAGFDRQGWPTGYAGYRNAVPALAGGSGRAIYNDVGQAYLSDPGRLFDLDMGGAGLLAGSGGDAPLLIDCERMAPHRILEAAQDAGLWGELPADWQVAAGTHVMRDGGGAEWQALEQAALDAGFTGWTKSSPSQRFLELRDLYKASHVAERVKPKSGRKKLFRGRSLAWHIAPIGRLVARTEARTLLDYGSGKGGLYQDSPDHPAGSRFKVMPSWNDALITCYDPGYTPFSGDYEDAYDGVISTDVLEHIPEEDIAWVLEELFSHARKFVYAVATCYPARKTLPNGENAHCTIMPPDWWRGQMELAARRHPDVAWVLCTKERSFFALRKRKGLLEKGVKFRFFNQERPAAA